MLYEKAVAENRLEEVVNDYFHMKKSGTVLKSVCPFHPADYESFYVNPKTQTFFCGLCWKGGDAVNFIAKMEDCSIEEATKILLERKKI